MGVYVVVEAIIGVLAGILLATCSKKAEDVVYNKLDRASRISNVLLLIVYICFSPLYLFLGALATPAHEGFLGVIGGIVAVFCASVALFCGTGLGLSVALRKKGKSKPSFIVQFAGAAAFVLMFLLFLIFYGNLLKPLN